MRLPDGKYRTEGGSTVALSNNGTRSVVDFDWSNEDACIECEVNNYPDDDFLVWYCESCCGGRSRLMPFQDGGPGLQQTPWEYRSAHR